MSLEIGADSDHVHLQSVSTYSPRKIAQTIKSITAREVFARVPAVRQALWSGAFWSSGYYFDTVGRHGSEGAIRDYIAGQGRQREYRRLHSQPMEPPARQLELFWRQSASRPSYSLDTLQLAAAEISSQWVHNIEAFSCFKKKLS